MGNGSDRCAALSLQFSTSVLVSEVKRLIPPDESNRPPAVCPPEDVNLHLTNQSSNLCTIVFGWCSFFLRCLPCRLKTRSTAKPHCPCCGIANHDICGNGSKKRKHSDQRQLNCPTAVPIAQNQGLTVGVHCGTAVCSSECSVQVVKMERASVIGFG